MTVWKTAPIDVTLLFSPVGLRLIDEFTGEAPVGDVQATLDILDSDGSWRQTDIREIRTPSGVVAYPGLGRHFSALDAQPRQYRVQLAADLYVPHYQVQSDGIRFTAFPYNDTNPPATIARTAVDTLLLPGPNYPFDEHVPVLHGLVVDAAQRPVPNVYVTQSNKERSATDARGAFALPLRWAPTGVVISIDAADQRTGRQGSIQIQLPASLDRNQVISIA